MFREKRVCSLLLITALIGLGMAPLRAEGKQVFPPAVRYPTPYWNIAGATSTAHIFVNGLPVATVEQVEGGAPKFFWNYADERGSTKLTTNSIGDVIEVTNYDAFGSHDSSVEGNNYSEQLKFTSHEFDPSTNYTYAKARYLDTDIGRFISEDPAFWTLPGELLTDPQQMNSYAYARNNPLRYIDPDGKLNVIIGGTWGKEWSDWESNPDMKAFVNAVANTFGSAGGRMEKTRVEALPELRDNRSSRSATAERIAEMINNYEFADGETLNIVGHSHGGNVAALLSNMLDRKIDNMVTLGTPIRGDYVFNESNIGNHVNAYSTKDWTQRLGGGTFSTAQIFGTMFGQIALPGIAGIGAMYIPPAGEIGRAGNTIGGHVQDINVTKEAGGGIKSSHSKLWQQPAVWNKINSYFK